MGGARSGESEGLTPCLSPCICASVTPRYGGECGGGGSVTASAAVLGNTGGAAESQVPVRRVEALVVGVR
jgi:hypothetical protein